MANTLTIGERARPNSLLGVSMAINMIAVILGGSLSVHASAHQEYDWAIFFFLLGLLNAVTALVTSRSRSARRVS
jgi:intracellular septation protein A